MFFEEFLPAPLAVEEQQLSCDREVPFSTWQAQVQEGTRHSVGAACRCS